MTFWKKQATQKDLLPEKQLKGISDGMRTILYLDGSGGFPILHMAHRYVPNLLKSQFTGYRFKTKIEKYMEYI